MRDFKVYLLCLASGIIGIFIHAVVVEKQAHATASNDAVSVGSGIRFICQTSAPSPTGRARLWIRCSDGVFMFTNAANVDMQQSF